MDPKQIAWRGSHPQETKARQAPKNTTSTANPLPEGKAVRAIGVLHGTGPVPVIVPLEVGVKTAPNDTSWESADKGPVVHKEPGTEIRGHARDAISEE